MVAALVLTAGHPSAQGQVDFTTLTIEELLNVEVTSVSRKPQPLASAAAAVFVITAEDIRSSGASSLPEVLRLVPGVQVARYSNSKWSVSARGMGVYYASKLLVLVDGRSIYTPDFSGVYWDLHDVVLEDVERIEVIRGPGGTMWGANAVNGVINVITKAATDTTGGLVRMSTGTTDRGLASVRYGGSLGPRSAYRVFGKLAAREFGAEDDMRDRSTIGWSGFRFDYADEADAFTLQGHLYRGDERTPSSFPTLAAPYSEILEDHIDVHGANVLARWTRSSGPGTHVAVKFYYDRSGRSEHVNEASADVVDLDVQHRLPLGRRHDFIWGGEARHTTSNFVNSEVMEYSPARSRRHLLNAFAQDEMSLTPDVKLTLGAKIEHHAVVGLAVEPNARAIWSIGKDQSVWGGIARSVRTPSLADQMATFDYMVLPPSSTTRGMPVLIQVVGRSVEHLETVVAYESGYRVRPLDTLAIDVAAFQNEYHHLTSYIRGTPTVSVSGDMPHLVLPSLRGNEISGTSRGLEALATWSPSRRWSTSASVTLLDTHLKANDARVEAGNSFQVLLMSPRVQSTLRSSTRLTERVDLDATLQYVGPWQSGDVAAYWQADLRTGWRVGSTLKVDFGVQNLLDRRHVETALYLYATPQEVPRSAYTRLSWSF